MSSVTDTYKHASYFYQYSLGRLIQWNCIRKSSVNIIHALLLTKLFSQMANIDLLGLKWNAYLASENTVYIIPM